MEKSILIIGSYPPPFGGVGRVNEYLVPYLVKDGWSVSVLVLNSDKNIIEEKQGFTIYRQKGNKVLKVFSGLLFIIKYRKLHPYNILKGIISIKQNIGFLAQCFVASRIIVDNNINIVCAYKLHSGAPVGLILSKIFGLPWIVNNFGEIYDHTDYFFKHRSLLQKICESANSVISMTRHCAKSYNQIGLFPKVYVLPVGIDIRRFDPDNSSYRIKRELNVDDNHSIVLYLGRMCYEMGLDVLLEVVPELLSNDNTTIIIGGRKQDIGLYNIAESYEKKYTGRFFLLSNISFENLPFLYAMATIVVVPTKGDRACGSLAAAEAMATGKPVIASRIGGIPEFVDDGVNGVLIPPNDSMELKKSIINLLNDPRLPEMGLNARKKAVEEFDVEKTNKRYSEYFVNILKQRN